MNEILCKYQKTHGELKKGVLPMRFKEHPALDDSPFLNDKYHKYFQHIIVLCQWMIVLGRFDLEYYVSSLNRFLDAPQVGHLDLDGIIFGRLKKYPKRGYVINP